MHILLDERAIRRFPFFCEAMNISPSNNDQHEHELGSLSSGGYGGHSAAACVYGAASDLWLGIEALWIPLRAKWRRCVSRRHCLLDRGFVKENTFHIHLTKERTLAAGCVKSPCLPPPGKANIVAKNIQALPKPLWRTGRNRSFDQGAFDCVRSFFSVLAGSADTN